MEQQLGVRLLIQLHEKENAKDTLCRNVTIYGHCRYKEKGGYEPDLIPSETVY